MTLVLVIFVICVFVLLTWVILKMGELDELKEELDKYSVHLDERANRIAADEATLTQEWKNLRAAAEELRRRKK